MAATATLNTVRNQFHVNVRSEPETVAALGIHRSEEAEAQPMAVAEKPQRARMSFFSALLQAFSALCV